MSKIPKIIHQLWIGPSPAPVNMMKTWKDKHPNFEYIFWKHITYMLHNTIFVLLMCENRVIFDFNLVSFMTWMRSGCIATRSYKILY